MSRLSTSGGGIRLKARQLGAICPRMSLRPLLAILFAIATLLAPLAVTRAAAMTPSPGHHAGMANSGHCGKQPASGDDERAPDTTCCVGTCAAVAIAPSACAGPHSFPQPVGRSSLDRFDHGFLAELPTPPPRLA